MAGMTEKLNLKFFGGFHLIKSVPIVSFFFN